MPYLFATRDFSIHSRCAYLLHKLALLDGTGLSLLDVGCGAGIALRHLATSRPRKFVRYVGIDLAAERLRARYRRVRGIDIAFHDVDLDDPWDFGQFDVVWCSEVIEHLMDDAGQFGKLKQAAKPGGIILVTTPCLDFVRHMGAWFRPILTTSAVQDGGHVRQGYRYGDIVRLAADAGLAIKSIDGVNRLTLAETERRYTARRLGWIINNIRQSLAARGRIDFALGGDFKRQPEHYASIAAELVRPEQRPLATAAVETIARPPRAVSSER